MEHSKKLDRRTLYTKMFLRESLLALMQEKPIAKITSSELVTVTADYTCVGEEGPLYDVPVRYTVGDNGVIALTASFSDNDDYDDCLYDTPRFGEYFAMPENFSTATYFGRGPLENLPDIKV